jgi:hypothetical protein
MNIYKSQSLEASHIDNFTIRSKASDSIMVEPKEERIRRKERAEETGRHKQFLINGVDFHAGEIVVHRQGEVLEDVFSVKGDYFYLKRGEIVNIRFAIGEYVEIKFEQKVGYFPAALIRLIEGERWRTK